MRFAIASRASTATSPSRCSTGAAPDAREARRGRRRRRVGARRVRAAARRASVRARRARSTRWSASARWSAARPRTSSTSPGSARPASRAPRSTRACRSIFGVLTVDTASRRRADRRHGGPQGRGSRARPRSRWWRCCARCRDASAARYDRIGTTYARPADRPAHRGADPRRARRRATRRERRRRHRHLRADRPRRRRGRAVADDDRPASARCGARPCAASPRRCRSPTRAFDAALAVLTMHHWHDLGAASPSCAGRAPAGDLHLRARVADTALARRRLLPRDARPRDRAQRAGHGRHRAPSRRRARSSPCPFRPTASTGSAAATGTGPRRTSTRSCRPACRASRSCARHPRPRHRAARAPSSRRGRGTRKSRRICATLAECDLGYRRSSGRRTYACTRQCCASSCRRARSNAATLQLFEDADLAVVRASDVDYRASIDDPRVIDVTILRPAGDPALRRRRALRRRDHRARLDRGDRRRRRRRSPSCTTRRRPRARSAIVLAVAGDSRGSR